MKNTVAGIAVVLALLVALRAPAAPAAQPVLSDDDLLAMAGNIYASGILPLGDGRYVTDGPRKGYIYLCHPMPGGGGAQRDGPWIHGNRWNLYEKIAVQGSVLWSDAMFTHTILGNERVLSGNGLPINHATGVFPIDPSDPAYMFDRNPNRIEPHALRDALPLAPDYSDTPSCMGGEAGIMLTGVPLYNGFDTGMRDAAAHEAQDSCSGHPQRSGHYHYHSLSACIKNIGEKTVIGYALDGFPITGPQVAAGKYLTTGNLDECHGITSEIIEDGEKKVTYHYVMTQDFPYSVSCFRGTPVRTGPSRGVEQSRGGPPQEGGMEGMARKRQPPPEALAACGGKNEGAECAFTSPRGDRISGICRTPPDSGRACGPMRQP